MLEGHVYLESLDRTAWVLDWEVSNSETARDMEEGCDKGGVTPEMASYSILLQAPAVGSYQRKMLGWMELLHPESSSSALYSSVTGIPSCFQPHFHAVLQSLTSLRGTASIKGHYC